MDRKTVIVKAYESAEFNRALEESLHPGGLDITERVVERIGIDSSMRVLDLACGRGTSACFIARTSGCRVTGIDLSEKSLSFARERASLQGVSRLAEFQRADVEELPFSEDSFDVVICECSFSLQRNKPIVAKEIARVLRPGGVLGMSDVFLRNELDADLKAAAPYDCCFTNAETLSSYSALFRGFGLRQREVEDHSLSMTVDASKRLINEYGSIESFWGNFGAGGGGCSCARGKGTALGNSVDYWKSLFRQADPGYCVMIFMKEDTIP